MNATLQHLFIRPALMLSIALGVVATALLLRTDAAPSKSTKATNKTSQARLSDSQQIADLKKALQQEQEKRMKLAAQLKTLSERLAKHTQESNNKFEEARKNHTTLKTHHDAHVMDFTQLKNHLKDAIRVYYNRVGDNVSGFDTRLKSDEWVVGIVGFYARDGDILEDDSGDIIYVWPYVKNGTWWIKSEFRSHKNNEEWAIRSIAIRRNLLVTYRGKDDADGR